MTLSCDFSQKLLGVSLFLPALRYQFIDYLCIAAVPLVLSQIRYQLLYNATSKAGGNAAKAIAITATAYLLHRYTQQPGAFLIEHGAFTFTATACGT